jgi:flagellar biogenesis protein FliO
MKLLISAAMFVAVFGLPVAHATTEASIELVERGDAVEIIAHNVKAVSTAIKPVRSRLEVEVAGRPRTRPLVPAAGHKSLVIAELDGDGMRTSLSVKLTFNYQDVKTIARFAQASQVGDDLHLMFPRTVPAEGATVVLPEPTLPPEIAAKLAAPKPESKEETKKIEAKPETRQPIAPTPSRSSDPTPAATTTTTAPTATPTPPAKLDLPKDSGGASWQLYALGGVAALGAGIWLLKKKKPTQPATTIEVIAQRALGGKAKMVWVSVGEREMVVAVTQQQVRMLGQWPKGQQPHATGPMTYTSFAPSELPAAHVVERNDPARSSVAGLMKLRACTASQMNEEQAASILARSRTSSRVMQRPQVNEDIATGDDIADEMWAREIVAATGARR